MEVGFRSKVTVAPTYFKYKQSGPVTDQMYRDAMENVASYNSRLCHERRLRLPFLDSQTGVAQNHSNLWMGYRYRSPGVTQGQLYTYPAKRWRKKKRSYSQLEMTKAGDIETGEADMHAISAVENPAALIGQLEPDMKEQVPHTDILYKDIWYDEMDAISEPPDAGEIENRNSDSSDYEETYIKRRRKKNKTKSTGRGRGKKSVDHGKDDLPLDKEKPYVCDTCGARYKTRPGLNYHLNHNHDGAFASTSEDTRSQSPTIPSLPPTGLSLFNTEKPPPGPSASTKNISANNYCDFCLGDADKNMKTGIQEELVSCADCGRSGHPSCLQFTANMIISVKKYPWQCIECKSCGLCGTSDNDDQLLFCDDCDRGYHMYCLNPPLSEPPEGSWSCHLCIAEFHGGKLPESMKAP